MTKEEILDFIRAEEKQLYVELGALRRMYGWDNKSTKRAATEWNAVLRILQKIEKK